MSYITISKEKIEQQNGVVVLPLIEYKKLLQKAFFLTYYLKDEEALELDNLVDNGLKEYHQGKTQIISSLSDLN